MQLLVMIALATAAFLSMIQFGDQQRRDAPEAAAEAQATVDQYRMFMYVADRYMTTSAPSDAGVITVDWATMSTTSGIPPAVRRAPMPASWRVVRAADLTTWVACTEMDERAAAAIGIAGDAATANAVVELASGAAASRSFIVVGGATSAADYASLCNS